MDRLAAKSIGGKGPSFEIQEASCDQLEEKSAYLKIGKDFLSRQDNNPELGRH